MGENSSGGGRGQQGLRGARVTIKRRSLWAVIICFVLITAGVAYAHNNSRIDDDCGAGGTAPFWAAGPASTWYVHSGAGKAYGNCHMYTSTIGPTADVINYAAYYLSPSSAQDGDYYLWAYIACENNTTHWSTTDARYRRYRRGTANGVTETYHISQGGIVAGCSTNSTTALLTATASTPPTWDNWVAGEGGYSMLIDKSSDPGKYISADMLDYIAKH